MLVANFTTWRILVNNNSSTHVLFWDNFVKMESTKADCALHPLHWKGSQGNSTISGLHHPTNIRWSRATHGHHHDQFLGSQDLIILQHHRRVIDLERIEGYHLNVPFEDEVP